MAYGRVIKMDDGHYKTPNKGVLMDLETGVKYTFMRESEEGKPKKWNVCVYDIVTFTASGTNATGVTLYRKHINGVVYSYES